MKILDAIRDAIDQTYRHYAYPDNVKQVNQVKALVDESENRINLINPGNMSALYCSGVRDCKDKILNMEVSNE